MFFFVTKVKKQGMGQLCRNIDIECVYLFSVKIFSPHNGGFIRAF